MGARKGLGELLIRENLISLDQLEKARREQKKHGGRLMTALVRMGYVKDKALADFIGQQYNLPTIDLSSFEIDAEVTKMVPRHLCEKHVVIPVQKLGRNLVVAFADPTNIYVKDDLSLLTRCKIEVVVASETAIIQAIDKYYEAKASKGGGALKAILSEMEDNEEVFAGAADDGAQVVDSEATADAAPIIKFVNAMLAEAIKLRASDIHVEPYEKRFRIRFRIDGSLFEKTQPPPGAAGAIVSRIKILSKMDIAERRKPQDGRLAVKMKSGQKVDFRVSTVPTMWGEKAVLRLLDQSNLEVDLTKLGFEDSQFEVFTECIHRPQGLILITGPTGSGKTTTIYSAIAELNKADVNISTAEDPIEFNLDGINQVQVNAEIGFKFADALRAFLRQDPEIIMVGEVRDLETAEVAYKAASTGHLVVSTLHTNDAASTVTRLVEMGIQPYVVAEATTLVVAQRLLRRVCGNCVSEHRVEEKVLLDLGVKPEHLDKFDQLRKGEGCDVCGGSGLKGRMAIFEVMPMSAVIKDAVFKGASPLDIKRRAITEDGMISLRGHALIKLQQGLTTIEEVALGTVKDDL